MTRLARLAGLAPRIIAHALPALDVVRTRDDGVVGRPVFEKLLAALPRLLAARAADHPEGMSRERLGALVPAAGPAVLDEALARLVKAGTLRQEGGPAPCAAPGAGACAGGP